MEAMFDRAPIPLVSADKAFASQTPTEGIDRDVVTCFFRILLRELEGGRERPDAAAEDCNLRLVVMAVLAAGERA